MEFVGRSKVSMVAVAGEKIPIGSSRLVSVETFQALLQIATSQFCGRRTGSGGKNQGYVRSALKNKQREEEGEEEKKIRVYMCVMFPMCASGTVQFVSESTKCRRVFFVPFSPYLQFC